LHFYINELGYLNFTLAHFKLGWACS